MRHRPFLLLLVLMAVTGLFYTVTRNQGSNSGSDIFGYLSDCGIELMNPVTETDCDLEPSSVEETRYRYGPLEGPSGLYQVEIDTIGTDRIHAIELLFDALLISFEDLEGKLMRSRPGLQHIMSTETGSLLVEDIPSAAGPAYYLLSSGDKTPDGWLVLFFMTQEANVYYGSRDTGHSVPGR